MPVTIKKQYGRELKEHTLYTKEELNSMFGGNIIQAGEAVGRTAELSDRFDTLDTDINQNIIDAFDEAGFYYNDQINQINDHISDLLDGKVTLGTAYNEVVISQSNGIVVTGYDGSNIISRINLRGSGTTQDGHSIAGIFIQKNIGIHEIPEWDTTFWVNSSGDIFMNGNLQLAEGSVLVGTRNDPVVFISQESAFQGITVTGSSSRTVIGEGQDDENTTFAGIAIQELVSGDWVSNFYADAQGNVFLRGEINATSGSLGSLTVEGGLESSNYVSGSEGFSINGITGDAEFNRVVIRNPDDDFSITETGFNLVPGGTSKLTHTEPRVIRWGEHANIQTYGVGGTVAPILELTSNYEVRLNANFVALRTDAVDRLVVDDSLVTAEAPFRLVRMTSTERDNFPNPLAGTVIYNTTESRPQFSNGTSWNNF